MTYPEFGQHDPHRRLSILRLAAILVLLFGFGNVFSQEPEPTTIVVGAEIKGVEGLGRIVPTYLCLLKAPGRHSGDILGTGSWITSRMILTCEHILRSVDADGRPVVHCKDGSEYTDCTIVSRSRRYDLALIFVRDLWVNPHGIVFIENDYERLDHIRALGWDGAECGMSVYKGLVTHRGHGLIPSRLRYTFGHSARVTCGMEGGPVLNEDLALIGVNVSGRGRESVAVELWHVQAFLDAYEGPTGRRRGRR